MRDAVYHEGAGGSMASASVLRYTYLPTKAGRGSRLRRKGSRGEVECICGGLSWWILRGALESSPSTSCYVVFLGSLCRYAIQWTLLAY